MCIAIYDVCDNIDHCDDKSDETHCESITNKDSLSANEKGKQLHDLHKAKENAKNKDAQVSKEKDEAEPKAESTLKQTDKDSSDLSVEDIEKLKLLKQQAIIIDHLKELEAEYTNNKNVNKNSLSDLKSFIKEEEKYESKDNKDDRYNPFNDLLKDDENDKIADSRFDFKNYFTPRKQKPKDLYKTTPKPKINFHGILYI